MSSTPQRKIKVLEVIRQGSIGGGESHLLDLVDQLDKDLFEPVVISFTGGDMIARLDNMGIKNYVIPSKVPFALDKWNELKNIIDTEKVDVIHAHGARAYANILTAAKGIPVVYTIHGWTFHDNQSFLLKKARILLESYLTSKAFQNISVSNANQQKGKDTLGSFSSIVIQNGIDLKKFDPDLDFKNIRDEYGVSEDEVLIGYIARITIQKDPLTMLKAFSYVVKENKKIRLLMVGEGDLKDEALSLAAELGIEDHIIFEKFRKDVPDILNGIDIYCLPSLWEGFPIGLLEAMAMKKAIVATNVDGTVEAIEDGQNGILVSPNQESLLAKRLLELADDCNLRKLLGNNARSSVMSKKVMTEKIEKLYKEATSIEV